MGTTRTTGTRTLRTMRSALLLGVVATGAGCGSEGTLRVCTPVATITGPAASGAAFHAPVGAPVGARVPALRFHGGVTRDSTWPARLTQEIAGVRADSIVQVLLVHATAVTAADHEFVTVRAGFVAGEIPASNGILARFTVASLRTFIPQASTTRIIDAHLSTPGSIPTCD